MTKEEFTKIFSDNPNADEVMTEINRLYDEESRLVADFATADAERNKYKQDLELANKRYRERFLNGSSDTKDKDMNKEITIDDLFKEGK